MPDAASLADPAQQTSDATLTIPNADHVSANYTLVPGGDTGWRTTTGDTVIAAFKGTVAVEQARGCSAPPADCPRLG